MTAPPRRRAADFDLDKTKHLASYGGFVLEGYEPVRDAFLQNFEEDGQENSAQVCAYVRGVKVVDLWASRDHSWYGHDSLQNVFSSSKVLSSLVVAMLVDRGHMAYEDKVAKYWPEFAQNGKQDTTIAMLMRHEAGLAKLSTKINVLDLTTEAISRGAVSDILAAQKPMHPPGKARVYHAISRGWFVNEVVRRCDPQHRTIGQIIRDDIARPIGHADELVVGVPDRLQRKIAGLKAKTATWTLRQAALPRFLGGGKLVGAGWRTRLAISLGVPMYQAVKVAAQLAVAWKSRFGWSSSADTDDSGRGASNTGLNAILSGEWAMNLRLPLVTPKPIGSAEVVQDAADRAEIARIRALAHATFKRLDRNNDGRIDNVELAAALSDLAEESGTDPLNEKEFFQLLDSNHDGVIDEEEFVDYSTKRQNLRATFNRRCVRRAELPSANAHCSAQAMAAAAYAMVNGGVAPCGHRLMSPEGVASAVSNSNKKILLGIPLSFTNCGVCDWGRLRHGYVGWLGIGGSVMQWHPEEKIGFAYAMDTMEIIPWNARGYLLQEVVLKCARQAAATDHVEADTGAETPSDQSPSIRSRL